MISLTKISAIASLTFSLCAIPLIHCIHPSGVHIGEPPAELHGSGKPNSILSIGDFRGSVTYFTSAKRIGIRWDLVDPNTGGSTLRGQQSIHLSFWPTEVITGDPSELIVAGKRARGATCIQVISLDSPTVLFPVGSSPIIEPAAISGIDEIYGEKTVTRDMVSHIFEQHGANGEGVFVQFWDSKDVYLLSKISGSYALVASPVTTGTGVITEPALNADFDQAFTYDHKQMGFIYGFHSPQFDPSKGALLLIDDDASRDGVLDSSVVLSVQDWVSTGMGDPDNYNDL